MSGFFRSVIDIFTIGSDKPLRRLAAYYGVVSLLVIALAQVTPLADLLVPAGRPDQLSQASAILQDGLSNGPAATPAAAIVSRTAFALSTIVLFVATLALMLPVTWVYMSDHKKRTYDQAMVETLLVLPIVVAGTVLIVRNSLALAFSLAGVVAAVRFRTSLSDTRDVVFIFLAIAIGFAAGVQVLTVAAVLSVLFNLLLVLSWKYGFGRSPLQPAAGVHWKEPLEDLATTDADGSEVPDRELVMALTPAKADVLTKKFKRIKAILGNNGDKPRYNAIVSITTNGLSKAQSEIEPVLDDYTRRWTLDEVITNEGKASELFYLVRSRKRTTRNELLTAIRTRANGSIQTADLEMSDALSIESGQLHDAKKLKEHRE